MNLREKILSKPADSTLADRLRQADRKAIAQKLREQASALQAMAAALESGRPLTA